MAWHIFEKLLEEVANYSPFIGKVWITFIFIFRLIMVVSIGDTVYGDEQSSFKCNTLEPGCENICYNRFAPISQIRFWAVQILFVGTPSIMFVVYATHRMTTIPPVERSESTRRTESDSTARTDETQESGRGERKRRKTKKQSEKEKEMNGRGPPDYEEVIRNGVKITISSTGKRASESDSDSGSNVNEKYVSKVQEDHAAGIRNELKKCIKNVEDKDKTVKAERKTVYAQGGTTEVIKTPGIVRAYAAQAVLRTVIEVGFLYLQYRMYNFIVPEMYVCEGYPCPRIVECFVSRPTEKTLFLRFMYIMSLVSLLLNVIELYLLISKWVRRTCCSGSKTTEVPHGDRLPMEEIIIDRQRGQHGYRRARMQNTFPDLGPFPRFADGVGDDGSDHGTMDSDYRFYDL
uniref:Gap junction protein n=1 Tax=Phallusia mammillata TaxID=59560 RepID=A0A6F9DD24_9ASCI|nr:gap junction alpha-5 protein [Phallusia mammillata]